MPGGDKTRRRELALAALISEPDTASAARKAGISERTLKYWLAEKEFAAEFQARARGILDNACAFVNAATQEAIATLRRLQTCGKPSTEARAADAILNHSHKFGELMDVLRRLEELEAWLVPSSITRPPVSNGYATSEHQEETGQAQ